MANEYQLTGLYVETVAAFDGEARTSGIYAEVVAAFDSNAQLAGMYVEVVRSIEDIATSTRRRQAMIGSF